MNPFEHKSKEVEHYFMDWQKMYPKPYNKNKVSPYTKTRIILMNGTEYESNWFLHQFSRHCNNNDLRREIAMVRRHEQQQQKMISSLKPIDESNLEISANFCCSSFVLNVVFKLIWLVVPNESWLVFAVVFGFVVYEFGLAIARGQGIIGLL